MTHSCSLIILIKKHTEFNHLGALTMITIKQLIENSNINPTLIRAVVKQLGGIESFNQSYSDVCNHGISGGFSGFIYYCDTVQFAKKHKKAILELAKHQCWEIYGNTDLVRFFAGFNCIDLTENEISDFLLFNNKENETEIYNALAWYVGEEVCRIAGYIDEN